MSFIDALLSGNTQRERRQKTMCAIAIAITAALLVIAVIVFAVCQIAGISTNTDSEKDTDKESTPKVELGETVDRQLSPEAVYSGNLLTLNSTARYKGEVETVNLQERKDRPKTDTGENSYTVLKADRTRFYATEETAAALNKMLQAFYNAKKDDNILISGAYDTTAVSSQDAVFSSGEAIALSYFHDYATNGINDPRSIYGVDLYKWIYSNAHKYGFVAVSAKSNVFRYIGIEHATAVKFHGLSLDNYLKQLKSATIETPMLLDAKGTQVAYYCPITDVKVPKNYSCTISGNNVDGVIVTVTVTDSSDIAIE